ncbi:TolC family protein [Alkalimarinus alittae]|uniref:TolC family protein n=1 Tax=Alkalimarinus alittae TaxID=2961619 RepID=A0ABY6MXH6_9ALTE|nr:TolC family protein [Alkalimarinus alittae]UZE94526.1 TolC family protein [Alkalimarinus alittae]
MKGKLHSSHFSVSVGKAVATITFAVHSALSSAAITIEQAQLMAVSNDSGIAQFQDKSKAASYEAVAMGQLPDPILIVGAQNIPTDTFQFDQEPMSQIKVGIKQMFPQGDTLSLRENKLNTQASSLEDKAQARYLTISRQVRNIWLEIFYWEQASQILNQDQALFQQLLEVTRSLYSVGNVKQQDVLRAELELSRLHERVIKANRRSETQRALLSRWVGGVAIDEPWSQSLPILRTPKLDSVNILDFAKAKREGGKFSPQQAQQEIAKFLQTHPTLIDLEKQVNVADHEIRISEQRYKPTWGVELNYGYRDGENNDGSDRSDFVSAMVNVSLPLFANTRQDKSVQSAVHRKEAQKNIHQDMLRKMVGEVQTILRRLQQTEEQLALFDEEILTKASLHAEASLNAYQADAADFSEVMRAFISEQGDRLDYARLQTTRLQLISALRFYFPTSLADLSQLHHSDSYLIQSNLMSSQGESR